MKPPVTGIKHVGCQVSVVADRCHAEKMTAKGAKTASFLSFPHNLHFTISGAENFFPQLTKDVGPFKRTPAEVCAKVKTCRHTNTSTGISQ